jgi:hypothetical protein
VDPRFDLPLYTRADVALHLGLPATTLGDWLRSGALEAVTGGRGEPTITFAGLVETHMLRELRYAGLSLQAIGEAALALRSRAGRHYPLAWSGLAHDGRDLLVEIAVVNRAGNASATAKAASPASCAAAQPPSAGPTTATPPPSDSSSTTTST